MMKLLVKDDVVINIVEFDPEAEWTPPVGALLMDGVASIGDVWNGEAFVTPAPTEPVPEELSRWQFFAAAALAGIISQQEAQDAITGPLPAPFVAFIASLPEGERFTATMLLRGNQVFHRHHPFVQAFLDANGMTDVQADAIWRAGAALGA